VIDPITRKVYSDTTGNFLGDTAALTTRKEQALTPLGGQEGRSLEWQENSRDSGFDSAMGDAIKALVDPQRPKRSVTSLLSQVLSAIPDNQSPFIIVDQDVGAIRIVTGANRGANGARCPCGEWCGASEALALRARSRAGGDPVGV
jgi:hypothetical protein